MSGQPGRAAFLLANAAAEGDMQEQIDQGRVGRKHGRPLHHHHHHALRGRRALTKQWPDGKGGANALLWRLFDILRLIQGLHGGVLPDDDEGRSYLHLLAHTIWSGCKEPVMLLRRIVPKVALWADVNALLDDTAECWARRPVPYSARQAGKIIKLADDKRTATRAWRLKPVDLSDRQLAERQRRKRCARAKKRRRERKLAAASPTVASIKPTPVLVIEIIAAEGCSRSTAYRRIKAGGEVRVPLTESRPWIEAGFNCRRTWERHGKPCRKRETRPVASHGKTPTKSGRSSPSCRNSETKRVPDIHLLSSSNECAAPIRIEPIDRPRSRNGGHHMRPERQGALRTGVCSKIAARPSAIPLSNEDRDCGADRQRWHSGHSGHSGPQTWGAVS